MQKAIVLLFAIFMLGGLSGCSVASPDAGHEAVWVENPCSLVMAAWKRHLLLQAVLMAPSQAAPST